MSLNMNFRPMDIRSKMMTEALCTLLTGSGFKLSDDTFAKFYEDRDIVLLNASVVYPEEFGIPDDGTDDDVMLEYRNCIFELVKTLVDDDAETWIVNVEMVAGHIVCGEWEPLKTNSKFYITLRSSGNWYEIDLKLI